MCGIAGIIQTEPRLDMEQIRQMTDALAHRGPDGEGHWKNNNSEVLFGHRRLSIIDLSDAGCQPLHYRERYTIVHNGEIYNYKELREELEKKGYSFSSRTDTEVIVAAYDQWKKDCVKRFDGMFSFAIWDESEKELFAARDRFGEKPFFYTYGQGQLLFASEMKALWKAGIEKLPNQKMLFNFITIGYTDNPSQPGETFFENIFKLPPASVLSFNLNNEPVIEKYWDLDPSLQNKNISDDDAIENFNELMKISVNRRLRSDVSIGTSLSGGIDSSSVIAIAKGMTDAQLKAFTAVFPGFEKDESVYAKQVADKFGLSHFTTSITAEGLLDDWEKLSYHHEEPFGSASVFPQFKVFQKAKEQNTKVLLDGQGADEILAGYHKYYKWYWRELYRARKLSRSKELRSAQEHGVNEKFGLKNMIAAYFPDFSTIVLERQYLLKAIRHEDLTHEFVKLQSKEAYYTAPSHYHLNGVLYFNTITHGLEELLRYADRNAMAHGCEARLPFLSHELVEFIFSLPSHFKIRQGWTKWILRESMKEKLPDTITWRKDKIGFEPPQRSWMENADLQSAIRDAKKILIDEGVLKKEVLEKKINPMGAHEADNYDWRYFSSAEIFKK